MGDHPDAAAGDRRDCDNKLEMLGDAKDAAAASDAALLVAASAASSALSRRRPRPGKGERPEGPEDILYNSIVQNARGERERESSSSKSNDDGAVLRC
jgi:hypothetical protein